MALKKMCPGCGKMIDYSLRYCSKCSDKYQADKKESNKHYDKFNRNKKNDAFYHSKEWLKVREIILNKYRRLDLYAYYVEQRIKYASPVHHIVELNDNWDRRLDIKNLIPLSTDSHNKMDSLYKNDKVGTQKVLFGLLDRWESEFGEG